MTLGTPPMSVQKQPSVQATLAVQRGWPQSGAISLLHPSLLAAAPPEPAALLNTVPV